MIKVLKFIGQIAANIIGFVIICIVAGFWWSIATRAFQLGSF
jgi:hypothetical protein